MRQRPYLHFLILTLDPEISIDSVDALVEKIFADQRIFVSVYSECDEYIVRRSKRVVTKKNIRPTYQFGINANLDGETVTKVRIAKTAKELIQKDWTDWTFFPYINTAFLSRRTYQCGSTDDGEPFEAVKDMRPLAIDMMARKWGARLDLQAIIPQHCEEAGLRRIYRGINENRD